MTGTSAACARRFSAASRSAIGRACCSSASPPGNSRSLITSISRSATSAVSGALPCRSAFWAGVPAMPLTSPRHVVGARSRFLEQRLLLYDVAAERLVADLVEEHGQRVAGHAVHHAGAPGRVDHAVVDGERAVRRRDERGRGREVVVAATAALGLVLL